MAPSHTAVRVDEKTEGSEARVPGSLADRGALRFWLAVVVTGVAAGLGAAGLTALLKGVQGLV